MAQHQLNDPLAPGMPPVATRVLAVGGDTTRLHLLVTNLRLRGYLQVTSSIDPRAAMAGLRLEVQGGQDLSFHVVMVDTSSQCPGRDAALEFAVGEPQLCGYAIRGEETFGPLTMEELDMFWKSIYNAKSNGLESQQVTPDGGEEVERDGDGDGVEMEQQQPTQKPKKDRVVWTHKRHKKFVEVYKKLAITGDAVPKKIHAMMGDPTLTRENIASHLQKYRLNLARELWRDPPQKSHSRTKHHRLTPQASFPSPNIPGQQAPTIVQSCSATIHVNHLVICMETLNIMDKSNMNLLVDLSPKYMYPGADDPKQNSVYVVGNSDASSLQEDHISVILSKEPEPSWDAEFLSNGD